MTLSPEDRAELWVLNNGDRTEATADELPEGVTTEHITAVIRRHAEKRASNRRGIAAYHKALSTPLPAGRPPAPLPGDPAKGPHGTQPNTLEAAAHRAPFWRVVALILAVGLGGIAVAWLLNCISFNAGGAL